MPGAGAGTAARGETGLPESTDTAAGVSLPFDPGPGPDPSPGFPLRQSSPVLPYTRYQPPAEALAGVKPAPRSYTPFLRHHVTHMKLQGVEPSMIRPGYQQRLRELVQSRTGRWLSHVYIRAGCIELVLDCEEWGSGVLTRRSAGSSWSPYDSYGPPGSADAEASLFADAMAAMAATGSSVTDGSAAGSAGGGGGGGGVAGTRSGGHEWSAGGVGSGGGGSGRGGGSSGSFPEGSSSSSSSAAAGQQRSTFDEGGPVAETPSGKGGPRARLRTLKAPHSLRLAPPSAAAIPPAAAASGSYERRASLERRLAPVSESATLTESVVRGGGGGGGCSGPGPRHLAAVGGAGSQLDRPSLEGGAAAGGLGAWEVVKALQLQLPRCSSGDNDATAASAGGGPAVGACGDVHPCGAGGGGAAASCAGALRGTAMSPLLLDGTSACVASAAVSSALDWALHRGDCVGGGGGSGGAAADGPAFAGSHPLVTMAAGLLSEGGDSGCCDSGRGGAATASGCGGGPAATATMVMDGPAGTATRYGSAGGHALSLPRIVSLEPRVLLAGPLTPPSPPDAMTTGRNGPSATGAGSGVAAPAAAPAAVGAAAVAAAGDSRTAALRIIAASGGAAGRGSRGTARSRLPGHGAATAGIAAGTAAPAAASGAALGSSAVAAVPAPAAGGFAAGAGPDSAGVSLTLKAVVRCNPLLLGGAPLELLVRSEGRYLPALVSTCGPAALLGGGDDDAAAGDDVDGRLAYNIELPMSPPPPLTSPSRSEQYPPPLPLPPPSAALQPGIILVDLRLRDMPVHAVPVVVVRDAAMASELRAALAATRLSDDDRDSLLMDLGTWVFHAAAAAAARRAREAGGAATVAAAGERLGRGQTQPPLHPRPRAQQQRHALGGSDRGGAGGGRRRAGIDPGGPGSGGARSVEQPPQQRQLQEEGQGQGQGRPGLAAGGLEVDLLDDIDIEGGGGERLGMLGLHLLRYALAAGWWCTAATLAADLMALGLEREAAPELRSATAVAAAVLAAAAAAATATAAGPTRAGAAADGSLGTVGPAPGPPQGVVDPEIAEAEVEGAASVGLSATALAPPKAHAVGVPPCGCLAADGRPAGAAGAGPSCAASPGQPAHPMSPQSSRCGGGAGRQAPEFAAAVAGASPSPSHGAEMPNGPGSGTCESTRTPHAPNPDCAPLPRELAARPGSGAQAAGGNGPLRRRAFLHVADSAAVAAGRGHDRQGGAASGPVPAPGGGASRSVAGGIGTGPVAEAQWMASGARRLSAAGALLLVLGLRRLPAAEEAAYWAFARPRMAAQGCIITALELVMLFTLLAKWWCYSPTEPPHLMKLVAFGGWVSVVEVLLQTAGGRALQAMGLDWPRAHQVCKLLRYVSYMATKVLCIWEADLAPSIETYTAGVAVLIHEGLVQPASCLMSLPMLSVLTVVRLVANVMIMCTVDTRLQGGRLGLLGCTARAAFISFTEVLTSAALHVYYRVSYSRWAAAKRRRP